MKCMNDLMAARRMFLEPAPFPRASSRWPKKFTMSGASSCSRFSSEGGTFRRWLAYWNRSLNACA